MLRLVAAILAAVLLCAQTPMLPGFPPGTFQSRAALDAASSGGTPVTWNSCSVHATGGTGLQANNITVGSGLVGGILTVNMVMGDNVATPTAVTAIWDFTGTNQSMTAVPGSPATSGNQSIFSFYLLNPTPGNNILLLSWAGGGNMTLTACVYSGASGVANFNSSTGGTPQQVTITAGANDAVFGAFSSISNFSSTGATQVDIDNIQNQWATAWQRAVGPNPTLVGNPGNATSLSAGFAIVP